MVVNIFVYSFVKLLAIAQLEVELIVTHILTTSKNMYFMAPWNINGNIKGVLFVLANVCYFHVISLNLVKILDKEISNFATTSESV